MILLRKMRILLKKVEIILLIKITKIVMNCLMMIGQFLKEYLNGKINLTKAPFFTNNKEKKLIEIHVHHESVETLKQLEFKYSIELENGEKIIKKVNFWEISAEDNEKEEEKALYLSMLPALTNINEV